MFLRVGFLLAALAVMVSGGFWWVAQRRANATATAIKNLSAIAYSGTQPEAKKLATQLSSYKFKDEKLGEQEHKLFKQFTEAEEKKDPTTTKTVMRSMSNSYKAAGEPELAVQIEKQSIDISKARKEHKDVAGSLQQISDIYQTTQKYDQSIEYDNKAAKEYKKLDAKKELSEVLKHLATTYKKKGLEKEAQKTLKQAEKVVAGMHSKIKKQAEKVVAGMHSKIKKQAEDLGSSMTSGIDKTNAENGEEPSHSQSAKPDKVQKAPASADKTEKKSEEPADKPSTGDDDTT